MSWAGQAALWLSGKNSRETRAKEILRSNRQNALGACCVQTRWEVRGSMDFLRCTQGGERPCQLEKGEIEDMAKTRHIMKEA